MIHLFYGENDFAIKRAVDAKIAKFSQEFGTDSVEKIDAAEADFSDILSEIVNINMFAPRRLIVLSNTAKNKTAWTKLGENIARVPDETELIIVEPKPDKRTKTFKDLRKFAKEFSLLRSHEINAWAMDEAHRVGVEIKRDAVDELVMRTGGDQWLIAAELAKFASLGKVVDTKLVQELTEANVEASAFAVLDHAMNGQRAAMQQELANLRKVEDANKFMGLLASQIFALNVAVNANGKTTNEAAKDAGIHPFVMSKMFDVARKIEARDAKNFAKIVAKTDAKMKLSNANDAWNLVEIALSKIVR